MISSPPNSIPKPASRSSAVTGNHVEGNLTIKGITKPVAFDIAVNVSGDTLTAAGKVVVEPYGLWNEVPFGQLLQGPGRHLIYNDFDLNLNITAKAVA